jgi:hypothetical protein
MKQRSKMIGVGLGLSALLLAAVPAAVAQTNFW